MVVGADFRDADDEVFQLIENETKRQADNIELIPSENYTYPEVMAALGSVLTNKYAEGYPGRRYYGGQQNTDEIEELARRRACVLFRAEHANVQPLSGSPMNQAVYFGLLQPGDRIIAMDLSHGGHLTHGAPVSHMGKIFDFQRYKCRPETGEIDFDELRSLARRSRPKMILCGHSSYPKELDYAAFREIADEVGAIAVADVSHLGGLIAAGVAANPFDFGFDVVTTTTHKTLRGPRGGMILCKREYARNIDASVFPGLQGGPHMNAVAATAITLRKAAEAAFVAYARQTLANAKALADTLLSEGCTLVGGGTENHLMVLDTVRSFGMDGAQAEALLDGSVGITVNKQLVPDDPRPPMRPSGIRLGTPACTTRGMKESEMVEIGRAIVRTLRSHSADGHEGTATRLRQIAATYPIWPR